ncbi:MAG: Lrp/AsnC family transcriptional regulator [Gordonia sp. (in: high G+C Gram-positive bacteria)]|uniref:Lrp/AsnC family transcriptional regulator n=1 Tax=Gordonia sp. (in: high G+C Gram-positive bacteria) TaxID=84139 RepID=UPI0039E6E4B7
MDKIDRAILRLLQRDGRMRATEIATRVGLSVSSCHRRMKDLEAAGVILGYRAELSPAELGLTFEAIVFVTIDRTDLGALAEFEAAVERLANVVEAERLFGDPDYMLRVRTKSLDSYQVLYDTELAALPGVGRMTSTIVMKRLREGRALPI